MTQHRSDLVENLQSEGLYYVDLLDAGDLCVRDPINTEDIWVSFDFSGRDLAATSSSRAMPTMPCWPGLSQVYPLCAFLPLLWLGKLRTDGRDVAGHAPYADARRIPISE